MPPTADRGRAPFLTPAIAGMAAILFGLGVGELLAFLMAPASSPLGAVASASVDLAPSWAKEAAIALFGTGDKIALLVGISIVALLVAALAGVLEARVRAVGIAILLLLGLAGVAAVLTRADLDPLGVVPVIGAAVASAVGLRFLIRRLHVADRSAPGLDDGRSGSAPAPVDVSPSRRRFLAWAGGAAGLGALAAVGGALLDTGRRAVTAARQAIALPPAEATVALPPGAELDVPGISPLVTPTADFYRIDIAFRVPELAAQEWRLRIHGLVEEEFELGWEELLSLPMHESLTTLMCVSNEVGGGLIGNAVWLGHPIRSVLERARPLPEADMVLSRSPDGFTAGTPLGALVDPGRDAILAVGMNGEPLPAEHGFPVRMVVPGLYGYVSATKWVTELEVTRFDRASAYWTDRGWGERGPVKIGSRIDVPASSSVAPGRVPVAGVAWFQHTGLSAVEVRVDGGGWSPATLSTETTVDAWRQWVWEWDATPGRHVLEVRAIGADGAPQTEAVAGVLPDGATGLHRRTVEVR